LRDRPNDVIYEKPRFPRPFVEVFRSFELFCESAEETFNHTGPLAAHGRRIRWYSQGDRLYVEIPGVESDIRVSEQGLAQALRLLGAWKFRKFISGLHFKTVADILNELTHRSFQARIIKTNLKDPRIVSPIIYFPKGAREAVLRGINYTRLLKLYDFEICVMLRPYLETGISLVKVVRCEYGTYFILSNLENFIRFQGTPLYTGAVLANHESQLGMARVFLVGYLKELDACLPIGSTTFESTEAFQHGWGLSSKRGWAEKVGEVLDECNDERILYRMHDAFSRNHRLTQKAMSDWAKVQRCNDWARAERMLMRTAFLFDKERVLQSSS
jgi:hypothetical protein